jgi:hypothetical protein
MTDKEEMRARLNRELEERAAEAERSLRSTSNNEAFEMRGGQPGSWFDANENAYNGGARYEQSGRPKTEDMERRLRSAFRTY